MASTKRQTNLTRATSSIASFDPLLEPEKFVGIPENSPITSVKINGTRESNMLGNSSIISGNSPGIGQSEMSENSFNTSSWEKMTRLRTEEWRMSTHYKLEKKISSVHSIVSENIDIEHLWFATKRLLIAIANQSRKETIQCTEHIDVVKVNKTLQRVGQTVNKIAREISSKRSGFNIRAMDDNRTLGLLGELSQYSWHAKLAVFAAAFAVYYGEFYETYQLYVHENERVWAIMLIKQLPFAMTNLGIRNLLETISVFVVKLVGLVECVIGFGSLSEQYDLRAYMMDIKSAAYWAIDSMVYCSSEIAAQIAAINSHNAHIRIDQLKFDSHINRLVSIYEFLNREYLSYKTRFDGEAYMDRYQEIHRIFVSVDHVDNVETLMVLIGSSITENCLITKGQTDVRPCIGDLHGKKTMFLFSSLSIREQYSEDFALIERHYRNIKKCGYEIVWLPIFGDASCLSSVEYIEWIQEKKWYTHAITYEYMVKVEKVLKLYLQKEWGFDGRPMLTMFDAKGNLVCKNTIHNLWMVSSQSVEVDEFQFIFGGDMSPCGWSEQWWINWCNTNQTWGINLLCQELDVEISQWFTSKKEIVFLYGGKDITWFNECKKLLRTLFGKTGIKYNVAYVGTVKEKIEGVVNISTSKAEIFWSRVHSMVTSFSMYKSTLGEASMTMLSSLVSLVSLQGSGENWVAFGCGGMNEMVIWQEAKLRETLEIIVSTQCVDAWQTIISNGTFINEINASYTSWLMEYRAKFAHCCKLHLSSEAGQVVGDVKCAFCNSYMKKMVVYECCKQEEVHLVLQESHKKYEEILMSKNVEIKHIGSNVAAKKESA